MRLSMKKQIKVIAQLLLLMLIVTSCNSQASKNNDSKSKLSIAEAISVLPNATIKETIDYYHKLKKEQPRTYNFDDEAELNRLGYQYLNNGKIKEAIEIFKLLVSEFPNSSNPYDSLAEAYNTDGNTDLAIKNYEKSLELNPKNINAEAWINQLKYSEYDATRFYKKYSLEEYGQDLDELGRRLTEVNPNAYKFITKDAFWKALTAKKELLTEHTTFSEFIWHCSEIIATISCSHTSMGFFSQERKMLPDSLRFPLRTRLLDNNLYVINPLTNKGKVMIEDEVVEINGIAIDTIKNEIYKHISSQGEIESSKKSFFNAHSTSIIPYALNFPASYNVRIKNQKEPIRLSQLASYKDEFKSLSTYLCKEELCLNYLEDNKTAIMTVSTFAFYGNRFPEFKNFMDVSFSELSKKGIENLIIDVRGNGGGTSDAGIYLIRYLSQKPFTYFSKSQFNESLESNNPHPNVFKGKVYALIDGSGGSTTGHFMSLVKHLELATIVGEELGSNQFCTGGQKMLRLPNTGIIYVVGRNTYETIATSLPIERGIMPDHEVSQSIKDYLNHTDRVMEYTKALINKD